MPAYVVAQINVKHKEGFRTYAEKVPPTIRNFGGKYLVRAGDLQIKEGKWDFSRNVIIEFPSYEIALKWYNSDEYKPIRQMRLDNAEGNLIIVKGI